MKSSQKIRLPLLAMFLAACVLLPKVARADEALANGDRRPTHGGFDLDWDEEDEPQSGKFANSAAANAPKTATAPQAAPARKPRVNDYQKDINVLRDSGKSAQNFDDFFNQNVEDSSRRETNFVNP